MRATWWGISEDLDALLGNHVRALVLLALTTFAVWSVVFLVAGVPYALVLAGIGGDLEFLPVLGPLAAGVVALGGGRDRGRRGNVSVGPGHRAVRIVWRRLQVSGTSPVDGHEADAALR